MAKVPDSQSPENLELTDGQIISYLAEQPEFFDRHPEILLRAIETVSPTPRHQGSGVVDLSQFIVEKLRNEIDRLKAGQKGLLATGRSNLAVQQRVHNCVLAMLTATSLEHLMQIISTDLVVLLDLDAIAIAVERDDERIYPAPTGLRLLEPGAIARLFQGGNRECILAADRPGNAEIFDSAAGLVHSYALVRLTIGLETPPALLALGSRNPTKFNPGQATELLTFLAKALELMIVGLLRREL
ncbi:MAG: DUF484 family protein [Alphaproteobacteria bacterium]